MKVKELIEKLSQLDPESVVNFRSGYDPEYGTVYTEVMEVISEATGFDKEKRKPVYEVFIE